MRRLIVDLSGRAEFWLVLAVSFAYFISAALYLLLSETRHVDLSTTRVARGICIQVFTLLAVAMILRVRGWQLSDLGLGFSWKAAAGLPLFVLYLLLYWITATIVLLAWPEVRESWSFRFTLSSPFWLLAIFIIINSVFEEAIVVGYVMTSLSRDGVAMAITASTLVRLSYHIYQGPLAALSVIPLGLAFGALFWRWKNLWPLIVAHTIANLVASVANRGGAG